MRKSRWPYLVVLLMLAVCSCLYAKDFSILDVDLELYNEQIETVRKNPVRITLLDDQGQPAENALVKADQISHQFLFGNAPEYLIFVHAQTFYSRGRRFGIRPLPPEKVEEYKKLYLEIFNMATLPSFYWADYEPIQNRLRLLDASKEIANWLNENGIPVKGHTLVWGNPPSVGVPGWAHAMGLREEWEELGEYLFRRVRREVEEFKGLVQMWDVVNEPIVQPWFDDMDLNYIADSFRLVKEIDPSAVTILNEFGVLVNSSIRRRFINLAQDLLDENVPIDVIGAEAHIFNAQDIISQLGSLNAIYRAIDELAALGKPIHISEFQIPLPAVIDAFGVSIAEAEILQAEIARIFYTVFFSHPAVEVITYWNFYRAWQEGSGLLRDDLSLKPLFHELKRLIHDEWRTVIQAESDSSGTIDFRGFAGRYEISVEYGEKTREFVIEVNQGESNEFTLILNYDD